MTNSVQVGNTTLWVWLSAFTISLLCLLAMGFELFFAKEPRSTWVRLAVRCGLLALVLLAVADAVSRLPAMRGALELLGRTAVLALGVLGVYLLIPRTRGASDGAARVSWGLVAVAVLATVWTSGRFYTTSASEPNDLTAYETSSPEQCLSVLSEPMAFTDTGNTVTLYEYRDPPKAPLDTDPSHVIPKELQDRLISAGPVDKRTNCHGWVFTGGKYVVRSAAVDRILRENDYQRIDNPHTGDLIIYRNSALEPIHTGTVKATGNDGFVLIESKWGFLGQYLHEPKVQCYSKTYAYYRSPRAGHLLRIEEPGVDVPPSETPRPILPCHRVARIRRAPAGLNAG